MKGLRGVYKHIKTEKLYFVDGIARDVVNPEKMSVVYTQLYESKLRTKLEVPEEKAVDLPKGTMWMRDVDDFNKKFEKVPQSRFIRFATTLSTSLDKDILYDHNK